MFVALRGDIGRFILRGEITLSGWQWKLAAAAIPAHVDCVVGRTCGLWTFVSCLLRVDPCAVGIGRDISYLLTDGIDSDFVAVFSFGLVGEGGMSRGMEYILACFALLGAVVYYIGGFGVMPWGDFF
ncbi:hypothetical protein Tco_1110014 [Tanacetum coccineum]|uniref:Uncharacterized protein n=1 Tax=Tanacetum coccineum TaxID=301880 RepID=A0ABQ5IIS6_9ASTR